MNTTAIVQARMGSTRLPGKVLLPLGVTTVLGQVVRRLRASRRLDNIVIATSDLPADDAIAAECKKINVDFYRGDEQDVLSRYHGAASRAHADPVVRVTCDCPLFDPVLLDEQLDVFFKANAAGGSLDYLSNSTLKRSYPRGLDTEIFTFAALDKAHREATAPHEREHVTPYIYSHPELFRLRSHENPEDLSHHRWVLDTEADWEFIRRVYDELGAANRPFSTAEIIDLLDKHPTLAELNADVEQNHHDNRF